MLLAKHKKSLPFLIMIMLILIIGVVILFFTQISKKKVSFKTELFGLEELPEKWKDKVSYTVEADNSVVFTGLIDNAKTELLRVIPVTDVDTAWTMLDDKKGCCIFSKDYIYVFLIPGDDIPKEYGENDLRLGTDELKSVADELNIIKDGETRKAFDSIKARHLISLDIFKYDNKLSEYPDNYLGIYECRPGNYSGLRFFDFCNSSFFDSDEMIMMDNYDILFFECSEDKINDDFRIAKIDIEQDGINEYAMYTRKRDIGVEGCRFSMMEHDKDSHRLNMYELDISMVYNTVRERISETVDTDENKAYFSVDGVSAIEVNSEYNLAEREYELNEYSAGEKIGKIKLGYNSLEEYLLFAIDIRAGLAIKDKSVSYDYDYAPLITVTLKYLGKGKYEIDKLRIRKFGKDMEELDFSKMEEFTNDDYVRYWDPDKETEILTDNPYGRRKGFITQPVKVVSVNTDGTIVICPLEADDAPNDWLPGGIDVEMKIAEECVITYHPVESDGLIRRKISISDLKFLIENYEYWSELSGMIKEYVYAFECTYKDGVIYNFAELPFTKD